MPQTQASQEPGLRLPTRHSMRSSQAAPPRLSAAPARPQQRRAPALTGERDQRQEQAGAQEPSHETGARHVKEDSLIDLDSNDDRNYYNTSHITQAQAEPDRPYQNQDYINTQLNSSFNSSFDEINATYMNQQDLQTSNPETQKSSFNSRPPGETYHYPHAKEEHIVLAPRSSTSSLGPVDYNHRGQNKAITLALRNASLASVDFEQSTLKSETLVRGQLPLTRLEEEEAVASITGENGHKDREKKEDDEHSFIRIIFSTGKIYLVNSNCGWTIGSVIALLCDKQRPKVTSFDSYINNQVLDLSEYCSNLGSREVRVEADPEQHCVNVMDKICTTVTEAVRNVGKERMCETVQDEVCNNVPSRQCSVVTGMVSGVPDQECKVCSSYFKTRYYLKHLVF